MTDKKIVDDYYSQIDSSKDKKSEQKAKPKVVARKIIAKKSKVDSKKEATSLWNEKKEDISKKETKQKKWFVQKIEVNKRSTKVSVVKREDVEKRNEKQKRDNAPKKITVIKKVFIRNITIFINSLIYSIKEIILLSRW